MEASIRATRAREMQKQAAPYAPCAPKNISTEVTGTPVYTVFVSYYLRGEKREVRGEKREVRGKR